MAECFILQMLLPLGRFHKYFWYGRQKRLNIVVRSTAVIFLFFFQFDTVGKGIQRRQGGRLINETDNRKEEKGMGGMYTSYIIPRWISAGRFHYLRKNTTLGMKSNRNSWSPTRVCRFPKPTTVQDPELAPSIVMLWFLVFLVGIFQQNSPPKFCMHFLPHPSQWHSQHILASRFHYPNNWNICKVTMLIVI
jgi:hypothetical protein